MLKTRNCILLLVRAGAEKGMGRGLALLMSRSRGKIQSIFHPSREALG